MRFKEIYNERFSQQFSDRDFGSGQITKVYIPDTVEYDRMEVYAHSQDVIYTMVYKDEFEGIYGSWHGSFKEPLKGIDALEYYDNKEESSFMYKHMHPSSPTSQHEFSGVEPINPNDVYLNYTGPINIPKEFNMNNRFNSVPKGVRTKDDWDLN